MPCAMVLKYKITKTRFFAKINFYAWSAFTLIARCLMTQCV